MQINQLKKLSVPALVKTEQKFFKNSI